jgi:hypothetical protein
MLEDIVFSDKLRYENHAFIYDSPSSADVILEGVFGAALLCARLVDTDEGNRRGIAIDTDAERNEWIKRYEREVRRDEWGLLMTEVPLLSDIYIQFADSPATIYDFCPNIRLVDLAVQLMVYYMRYLVVEEVGEHIWEYIPWKAPFAAWLLDASRAETHRQRLLHIDWRKADPVNALADAKCQTEPPTLFFESEAAKDIMARYFQWLWTTYQAQAGEYPGTKIGQRDKNYLISQETEWTYLLPEMKDFDESAHELWRQWMTDWQDYLTHQLKPDKQILFWTAEVTEEQQEQLLDYLKLQEREPMRYRCLTTAIYALRYLGYVRRACTPAQMRRWLTEHLHDDYTTKSAATQFSRAWNQLGRYTPAVKDELNQLSSLGLHSLTH